MNVFNLFATLGLKTDEYSQGLDNAKSMASTFGNGVKAAAKVGFTAVTAATGAMVAFGKKSIDAGGDFDKSMSQVAATMGKSVDEIENLRKFAMQMGSTTAFSATESADALNYMALAGYDAEKSMAMLPNVLNLAAAGNMELAQASDMVTDTQSALGLSTEETTALVDKMAKASSKSNTSVEQLGAAMLQVGGTAKMMKGGTTEIAAALGILADNGTKGAEGGTALRNILLSISGAKFQKTFGALGVSAYDANGKMREMKDILADMNTVMANMSDEEKTQIISKTFNRADLKNVNALLATNVDRWNDLSSAIDNSAGAADKMAKTQLDNLQGDVTLFKSALEGAKIAVSDKLTPSLREFVKFGSEGLSKMTQAFNSGGIKKAMEEFGTILSDGLQKIVEKAPAFVSAGIDLLKALGQGLIDNAPVIIDSILNIVVQIANAILDAAPALVDAGADIMLQLITGIDNEGPNLLQKIIETLLHVAERIVERAPDILNAAVKLFRNLGQGLINALPDILAKLPILFVQLMTTIKGFIPEIMNVGVELFSSLVDKLPEIITNIVASLPKIIESLVSGFIQNTGKIAQAGIKLFVALVKLMPTIVVTIVKSIPSIISGIVRGFAAGVSDMAEVGANLVKGLWNGINNVKDWIISKVKGFGNSVLGAIKGFFGIHSPSKVFEDEVGKMLGLGMAEGIEDSAKDVNEAMDSLMKVPKKYSVDTGKVKVAQTVEVTNAQTSTMDKIQAQLDAIAQLLPNLANANIVLDTGALVGQTVGAYNEALGVLMHNEERSI